MKRKTKLKKIIEEPDFYKVQVISLTYLVKQAFKAIESGEKVIAKADEIIAERDAEILLLEKMIAIRNEFIEKMDKLHGYKESI